MNLAVERSIPTVYLDLERLKDRWFSYGFQLHLSIPDVHRTFHSWINSSNRSLRVVRTGKVASPSQGAIHIDPEEVEVFRAGLDSEEREAIQKGLKNGSVRLVFTTNALEPGIDIGGLDGVILAGFPDNMMSAWQRIGRAGRSWKSDAFVLYYARNNPLDRFYASNLKKFLEKPLDNLVVSPGNEDLIWKHVPSLLFETPDLDGGRDILGEALHGAAIKKAGIGRSAGTDWKLATTLRARYSGRWRRSLRA